MPNHNFLEQYIATRHPNSPAYRYMATKTARLLSEATISAADHLDELYCLREGIIKPAGLPSDMVAI